MLVCWGALLVGRIAMDHKVTSLQPGISGNAPLVGSCVFYGAGWEAVQVSLS